mgnify:CR=1 FL=1
MEFADFILAHDGDDLGALALSRGKYLSDVEDFNLALTTLEVRRKLRGKVPAWYAVPGLRFPLRLSGEQCSSEETAFYKALVVAGAAGYTKKADSVLTNVPEGRWLRKKPGLCVTGCPLKVADLTGGLGVDSWAFSKVATEGLYNEMQPELAAAAQHNFRELGVNNIVVRSCELSRSNLHQILGDFSPDLIYLDPARRDSAGRKVFRLEDCSPNVLELLPDLLNAAPQLLLKLGPMADITLVCKQLSSVREVHVVAADGECKELLLLLERGYEGEHDTAVYENGSILLVDQVQGDYGRGGILGGGPGPKGIIAPGPESVWTRSKDGEENADMGGGSFLFEPGKALLKAGAFDLPCRFGLRKIGRHTHYYLGDVPEALKPFGKVYTIIEVVPLNNRSIKEIARRYPLASVTARNIPLTSDELRKKLGVKEGGTVHIFGLSSDSEKYLVVASGA